MKPIKVLIVEDSAAMRALIRATLSADKAIRVVGEAADPLEARDAIRALNPDVMTLDVGMPRMNGIEFLEKVMWLHPLPIIMISALTELGTEIASQAMEFGAVDWVNKPSPEHPDSFAELVDKVKKAARVKVHAHEVASQAAKQAEFEGGSNKQPEGA